MRVWTMVLRPLFSEICGWHETANLQANMVVRMRLSFALFNAIFTPKPAMSAKLGRLFGAGGMTHKWLSHLRLSASICGSVFSETIN